MREGGHVYLVGAGPGPVDLLTLRARRLIRQADVLAFDELVHPELLQLAPPHCEILAIGYRAGQTASRPPPLHSLVLQRAQEGLQVVRLKAGDPMIFARGGEEAAALAAAGINFSIVPGITAALAAASSCHLPLTWRGRSAELRLTTASQAKTAGHQATLALYMPRNGLEAYTQSLLQLGWPGDTPAAFVMAAAQRREICVRSSLSDLASAVNKHPHTLPGIVLIGESLRERLPSERRPKPLEAAHFLLARSHSDPSQIAKKLRRLGADVWEWPWIRAQARRDTLGDLLGTLQKHSVLVVSSAAVWTCFLEQLQANSLDLRSMMHMTLVAMSRTAGHALRRSMLHPHMECDSFHDARQYLETQSKKDRKLLILALDDEHLKRSHQDDSRNLSGSIWSCGHHIIQYPKLPTSQPQALIVPHRQALEILLSGSGREQDMRHLPAYCLGNVVYEEMLKLVWPKDQLNLVGNIEQLVERLQQDYSLQKREYEHGQGSSDSLHGSW